MSSDLKPCPFCSNCDPKYDDAPLGHSQICCEHCGSTGPDRATDRDAAKAWNTRPTEIERLTARKVVGPSREAIALAGQVRSVLHRLPGDDYSKTLASLNAFDAAILETKAVEVEGRKR